MLYFNLFLILNFIAYLCLVYNFNKNIKKQHRFLKIKKNSVPVSVIVAVKNGANSLPYLIQCLTNQTYSGEIEFIIVDDQSNDETQSIIKNIVSEDLRFKFATSLNGSTILAFKKKALDAGIKLAKHEWLLFTDVDCKPPETWVEEMVEYFTDEADYIIGISSIVPEKSYVSHFQSIDLHMLMAASYSQAIKGNPWACTGQNQAYRKSLFNKVEGFKYLSNLLQGDDTVFMQICRYANARIIPALTKNPMVARTEKTWLSFLKQRMRWAGDSKYMIKLCPSFFFASLITFITNFGIIFISVIYSIKASFTFLVFKFIFETYLFATSEQTLLKNQNLNSNYWHYWFIMQIPYIMTVGLMSLWAHKLLGWKK